MLAVTETAAEVIHLKLVAAAAKPEVEHLGRVFVVEYSKPERPDEWLGDVPAASAVGRHLRHQFGIARARVNGEYREVVLIALSDVHVVHDVLFVLERIEEIEFA